VWSATKHCAKKYDHQQSDQRDFFPGRDLAHQPFRLS
jgi:hypothetical protein